MNNNKIKMKKIYLSIFALAATLASHAQFFTYTSYRGAFGVQGAGDWTAGWTEWNPEEKVYPATTMTANSNITSNTTWHSSDVVFLQNKVYVTNGATLTIEPGCIIRGDKATEGTLIISKGAKIMAQGTSSNPIVFTSNEAEDGSRLPGDWGGVILLGQATMNQGSAVVEGGLDATLASYGGTNDADNSGILKYVRIEFAGFEFQQDKEINGLTLGAVGSGTTIDHIQVSFTNDDSYEWFGGAVNCKYLIAFRGVDDDFDTDYGYHGNVQFGLVVRDPDLSDGCACSNSESFESDNDGSGTSASPYTSAIFSNVTCIGPYRGNTSAVLPAGADFKRALRIRRNSALKICNSIFCDWPTGFYVDGSQAENNFSTAAGTDSSALFANNIIAGMASANMGVNSGSSFDISTYFTNNNNTSYAGSSSVQFVNPYPAELFNTPDYHIQAGSPAASGSDFTNSIFGTLQYESVKEISKNMSMGLFPNPCTDKTILNIQLMESAMVSIEICDITGRQVSTVQGDVITNAGTHTYNLDTQALNSGIYLVNVKTNNSPQVLKLTITK